MNSSRFVFLAAMGVSFGIGLFLFAPYYGAGAAIFVIVLLTMTILNTRYTFGEIRANSYFQHRRGQAYSILVVCDLGALAAIAGIISNEFALLILGLLFVGLATLFLARLLFMSNKHQAILSS